MSSLLRPFSGYVPSAEYAPRIVGPPSSMLSPEQKQASSQDELSFRHVVGRGAKAPYEQAMRWLQGCVDLGALQPVESCVLVHRLTNGSFTATGFIAEVMLGAYDVGQVKRHEATIEKTQSKMVDYMQSTRIFGNPVALAHRSNPGIAGLLREHSSRAPDVDFHAIDGANHSLWIVPGDDAHQVCEHINNALYITDGHHRLAAAAWMAAAEDTPNASLPAAVFAEDELTLGAFARSIDDENIDGAALVAALDERFDLQQVDELVPRPSRPHQLGVRVAGRSYLLTIPAALVPADIYDALDVNLLQDLVVSPLFGITDPRTDRRLSFTADTTDTDHDVDGCSAWFLPFPTSVPDVMAVADAGQTMPPKSTYFLPKVPSGLIARRVDA